MSSARIPLPAAVAAIAAAAALGAWAGRPRETTEPPAVRLERAERALRRPGCAIRRLSTAAPRLFAFEIDGRIEREDIDAMSRLMLAAFDAFDEVDMLILMRDFEGLSVGAALDPLRVRAQVRSLGHVRRYAVVGPPDWVGALITFADKLMPVEARAFDASEAAAAWAWVSAPG